MQGTDHIYYYRDKCEVTSVKFVLLCHAYRCIFPLQKRPENNKS